MSRGESALLSVTDECLQNDGENDAGEEATDYAGGEGSSDPEAESAGYGVHGERVAHLLCIVK